jgi:high affinity sulfate transporter 1
VLPILEWLPNYQRGWLRHDLIAGLTVLTVLVPEGLAYAQMAGMPPEAIFYTAPAALILYALFTTSRQIVVGATASIAAMSAAIVGSLVATDSPEFAFWTVGLALVSGLLFILLGVFRLGYFSNFFSRAVISGFLFGMALDVAITQMPHFLGLEYAEGPFFQQLWHLVTHPGEIHVWTFALGVASLILLFVLHKISHRTRAARMRAARIPAALVVLVLGVLLSITLDLHERGVHVVGHFVADLVPPRWPDLALADLRTLLPGALIMVLLGYVQTVGIASSFATHHHRELDANHELIALGAANLGAGLMQGFSVAASLPQSADNEEAGARSPLSTLVCAVLVLVTALFFGPVFHNLPQATLAAIVIHAMIGLMDVKELRRLYRVRRLDFAVAVVALFGVLLLGIVVGFVLAVTLSILALLYRSSRPHISVLGRSPDNGRYGDLGRHPDYRPVPGMLIVRPDAYLFFANVTALRQTIRRLIAKSDPRPKVLLLDLEASDELDASSADALKELAEELEAQGIEMGLVRVHAPALEILRRDGLVARIGEARIHHTVPQAVEAFGAAI